MNYVSSTFRHGSSSLNILKSVHEFIVSYVALLSSNCLKGTNSKSQKSFQAPGLHPRTAHHALSCISRSTYTCVRALPTLQGFITVFSRHQWVSALRFLTHWLQRPLSMSSRLNQISGRQHNAGVKSLSFGVQALGPNPKAAIYKPCDDAQVIYLLSVKRGQ